MFVFACTYVRGVWMDERVSAWVPVCVCTFVCVCARVCNSLLIHLESLINMQITRVCVCKLVSARKCERDSENRE